MAWLATGGFCASVLAPVAHAGQGPSPSGPRVSVSREGSQAAPVPPPVPDVELSDGSFELSWSKLSLQAPGLLSARFLGPPRASLLGEVDPISGYAFGQSKPFADMGGALMSIVTAGIPLAIQDDHERPRCRHYLRLYFRGRGAMVSWRMKF